MEIKSEQLLSFQRLKMTWYKWYRCRCGRYISIPTNQEFPTLQAINCEFHLHWEHINPAYYPF